MFEISQLSQGEKTSDVKRLNKAIKFVVQHPIPLKIHGLDLNTTRVVGFLDASLADNHEISTQLGHIIMLIDKPGATFPIHFKPYKSK